MKKILGTLKDLVKGANWDVSTEVMSLRSLDTSGVSVLLKSTGFDDTGSRLRSWRTPWHSRTDQKRRGENSSKDELSCSTHLYITFKYLQYFCRGDPLSPMVKLTLRNDSLIQFDIADIGTIRFLLAP